MCITHLFCFGDFVVTAVLLMKHSESVIFDWQTSPVAWGNLGNVLKNQGKMAEAEKAYRNALHYRGNMADMLYNLWVLNKPVPCFDTNEFWLLPSIMWDHSSTTRKAETEKGKGTRCEDGVKCRKKLKKGKAKIDLKQQERSGRDIGRRDARVWQRGNNFVSGGSLFALLPISIVGAWRRTQSHFQGFNATCQRCQHLKAELRLLL